ncbi:hypothetical protein OSTOST_08650 [Ostertagia ostertagi]
MFFYETGECIINRERRSDWPELFIDGVQDQLCTVSTDSCTGFERKEYYINHEKDVIIESMSIEECKAENLIGTERFPCRAFVYNAVRRERVHGDS